MELIFHQEDTLTAKYGISSGSERNKVHVIRASGRLVRRVLKQQLSEEMSLEQRSG